MRPTPHYTIDSSKSQLGLTLVEVMVSGMVLALALVAVVTILRTIREFEYNQNLMRQARHLAFSVLEDPNNNYYKFFPYDPETRKLNQGSPREIDALITYSITSEAFTTWSGSSVPFRVIESTVRWTVDGRTDTVKAHRIISEPQGG